ncbi:hypothetical protein [Pseudoalteromonas aurantia]|nr:hypothetical protein [Pseudoalteromonas aurantia]
MACKGKRADLADAQLAQSSNGYVIDGNSPFAQKKHEGFCLASTNR